VSSASSTKRQTAFEPHLIRVASADVDLTKGNRQRRKLCTIARWRRSILRGAGWLIRSLATSWSATGSSALRTAILAAVLTPIGGYRSEQGEMWSTAMASAESLGEGRRTQKARRTHRHSVPAEDSITILNARRHLERDGKITVSLPELEVEASDLEGILTPA
jgi:hypothetical protein